MKQYHPQASITRLCSLFGFSRQAYYDYNQREQTKQMHQQLILSEVKAIRELMPRIGSLKLHHMLKADLSAHHIPIGRDSFCTLLRHNGLMVKVRKSFYPKTTDSNHAFRKYKDLTPALRISGVGQLWVSDITYIRSASGFSYLSLITDAWSRKIIGHHLSLSLSVRGCLCALNKAIASLSKEQRPVHHSDRGIQYCSDAYISRLKERSIAISMTQNGSPYENAKAERINGILKSELGLHQTFNNYSEAAAGVAKAISTYNQMRPHMSLNMLTPQQVHQLNQPTELETNRPLKPGRPSLNTCQPNTVLLQSSVKPTQYNQH
jgi:transposase InsO family protein